jgi:hypothetical protein
MSSTLVFVLDVANQKVHAKAMGKIRSCDLVGLGNHMGLSLGLDSEVVCSSTLWLRFCLSEAELCADRRMYLLAFISLLPRNSCRSRRFFPKRRRWILAELLRVCCKQLIFCCADIGTVYHAVVSAV